MGIMDDDIHHHHHDDEGHEIDIDFSSPSIYRAQQHHQKSTSTASTLYNIPNDYRYRYHSHSQSSSADDAHDLDHDHDPDSKTPSLLSSPSAASSFGFSNGLSPLRRELSRTSLTSGPGEKNAPPTASLGKGPQGLGITPCRTPRQRSRVQRDALARRLSQLAQQITSDDDEFDDVGVNALTAQLDQMERSIPKRSDTNSSSLFTPISKPPSRTPQRPHSLEFRSRSDLGPTSVFSSPANSTYRSRYSELSASIFRDPQPEVDEEDEKKKITAQQANKIIAEATKLNDDLTKIVRNLKARQEESDHINALLIERAERAAQRILFLQSRIAHLECELHENDDELQHLRICLKAVEIQMPAHPDKELQRCLSNFREDYKALKRKRQNRSSMPNMSDWDTSGFDSSIFETPARCHVS